MTESQMRQRKPRQTPEDDLLRDILKLCKILHLRTAHFRAARTANGWATPVQGDGKGFPDLVIVGGGVLYRELKSNTGYPSQEQRAWISALGASGADVGVWRPRDWPHRIKAELQQIQHPVPQSPDLTPSGVPF